MTKNDAQPQMEQGTPPPAPPAKPKRAPARMPEDFLGYISRGGKSEIEALAAFMPAHPRAFWNQCKTILTDPGEHGHLIFQTAAADERTLRLACTFLRSRSTTGMEWRRSPCEDSLVEAAMAMKGKSEAWRLQRASWVIPSLATASASRVFDLISKAARHESLSVAESFAARFPDARLGKAEADRHLHGVCGYAGHGMASSKARAWEQATLIAAAAGSKREPVRPPKQEVPANAVFWIAARWEAAREADPATAERWGKIGASLIARGLPVEDSQLTLGLSMACPPLFDALLARRPVLGSPSFHCFHRAATLAEAFSRAVDDAEIARICAYEEGSPDATATMQVTAGGRAPKIVQAIPASAFALLAGRDPHPSWMGIGAEREFRVPAAAIAASLKEAFDTEAADRHGSGDGTGRTFTLASLAAALGKAPAPAAAPKKAPAKKLPKP